MTETTINRKFIYWYAGLLAAHVGIIWWLPFIPTQDGPSHVYNLEILHDLLNGGRTWGAFYDYQLRAVPNLGFHLLTYPCLHFFSPWTAERIFVSTYISLMGISVPVLLRTFGKPLLPGSFFVFPVIFNYTMLMGFYSYLVAVPLFLLAFSLAWKLRNSSMICIFIIYNWMGIIIFYFHLIPFLLLTLSMFAIAVGNASNIKSLPAIIIRQCTLLSPCILLLLLYLMQGRDNPMTTVSSFNHHLSVAYLIKDLFFFSSVNLSPLQTMPATIFIFLLTLCMYSSIKSAYQAKRRIGDLEPKIKTLLFLISATVLIYFIAPPSFGGGSYFNQRFPWVILLLVLPILDFQRIISSSELTSAALVLGAGVFLIVNAYLLHQQSAIIEEYLNGLHSDIPQGALVASYKTQVPDWSRIDTLMHAASYYGVFGKYVVVGNYEAALPYFPVHFKPAIGPLPSSDLFDYKSDTIDWHNYPAIQYLLGWRVNNTDYNKLNKFFHIIQQNGQFSLWKRNSEIDCQ